MQENNTVNNTESNTESNKDTEIETIDNFDQMECLCGHDGNLLKGIYSFGFERPSPIQIKTIIPMNKGHDIIAQSQSGTGKTGAFGIAILSRIDVRQNYPQAIILVNTRELASQIHHVLTNLSIFMNIKINLCIGGNYGQGVFDNMQMSYKSHILVGTPGRVVDILERDKKKNFRNKFRLIDRLKMLVLDEADVLLRSDFVDQIHKIITMIPGTSQICLFSATFPKDVIQVTEHFMRNPIEILLEREEMNVNLIKHYKVNAQMEIHKFSILIDLYQKIDICQAVIFTNSINKAFELGDDFIKAGYSVGIMHAKLSDIERVEVLKKFRLTMTRVLIATDLISRGIDVQQVGLVINYDMPNNPELYIHRVGRSGRFGKSGVAINLITESYSDKNRIRNVEHSFNIKILDLPDLQEVNHYLTGINGYRYIEMSQKEN